MDSAMIQYITTKSIAKKMVAFGFHSATTKKNIQSTKQNENVNLQVQENFA